ncbi:hypothetical protein EHS25_009836 [Saitozyma podzolica]|uniref:PhoD-like phosphatase domain-containing protein n=1 Tax=Saitozyma podzolica TaxID=1890683 RepID=A0A427YKE5_9TREE|nr:hypothetical protein EHS25_009836 [Saitozyma podzolica]
MFRTGAFARANSSIPMTNMLDDHDLIDGFGSYDDETQASPVMSRIGSRGYFWFLLFQLFVCDEFDGTSLVPGSHPIKSLLIGGRGAWIPFRSHSLSAYLGPKVHLLAVDCRAERRLDRIVSSQTYSILFDETRKLKGRGIEHLVILLGVPIAYPRMSFLEHFLGFKWNPFNALARHHALGLGKLVNNYNEASELLDDLNDHWCANVHKRERNWLVRECQSLALEMHVRITFLSGDVHLAAVGCLFTKQKGGQGHQLPASEDYRYMLNVVTSAIVNTPPPRGAAMMVSLLSSHKHRTLRESLPHSHQPLLTRTDKDMTDEIMLPLFTKDTNGSPMKRQFVMARRNYATVECLASSELLFDLRIEKFKGAGETKSYPLRVPPPRWQ